MNWVDSTDLRKWADRRDCQATIPQLVRKLIRASAAQDSLRTIRFPSGESIAVGGWDGMLESTVASEFIPQGRSVWEFGANKDIKGKADEDFDKRKAKPDGVDTNQTVYVFVTPRLWSKKDEWIKARKAEVIWKDVIVIDSISLEEWLEINPTVAAWLAICHLHKYPTDGIQTTENFWEEWSTGPSGLQLPTQIVTTGRAKESELLLTNTKTAGMISIQGPSRTEAIAFALATFKQEAEREEDFFSRSLIVDSIDAFRQLSVHEKPLILIPRFDDKGSLHFAVSKGHTVIVPVDSDAAISKEWDISLPRLDRDGFVDSLMKLGIAEDEARKLSKESARSITVLRRHLKFDLNAPKWSKPEYAREIIPALLLNRWNAAYPSDKLTVEGLAGEKYEVFEAKLKVWSQIEDSPLVKIGDDWRVTSSLDVWTNAAQFVTRADFEKLKLVTLSTFSEINPAFELDKDQRFMAGMFGKKRQFSSWIRQGQLQSLIIISVFGERLKLDLPVLSSIWVDDIIRELLSNPHPLYWKSIENELPLIAEASPVEFVNAIEKLLAVDSSPIVGLFEEEKGFMFSNNYYTGLLWALEAVAWMPEYLARATLILARLTAVDPGGSLSNRPRNSLLSIYRSWHPQTFANVETRLQVLEIALQREAQVMWYLIISLFPKSHSTAEYTSTMRWRNSDLHFNVNVTWNEIGRFCRGLIDLLLNNFDHSEEQLCTLIGLSTDIEGYDDQNAVAFSESVLSKVTHNKHLAWHKIRGILSKHRSYPDTDWALQEEQLKRYQAMYDKLTPKDAVAKFKWLFDDSYPRLPEGMDRGEITMEEQEKIIHERRRVGLTEILKECGLNRIEELSSLVEQPWSLGFVLAEIVKEEDDVLKILMGLGGTEHQVIFVQGFVQKNKNDFGMEWIVKCYDKIKDKFDPATRANLFLGLPPEGELWKYIGTLNEEVVSTYWKKLRPRFGRMSIEERVFCIDKLIEHTRYFTAIEIASHYAEKLPSELLVRMLEKAARNKASETQHLSGYEFMTVFEVLDGRTDVDRKTLLKLEWWYMGILSDYSSNRKPKLLHDELEKSPEFFVDVLQWVYRPDSDEQLAKEMEGMTNEQIQTRAIQADRLLESWKKIPGLQGDGTIDGKTLNEWIDKARQLAAEKGRPDKADIYIGKMFASIPQIKGQQWPPAEIAEVVERLNTSTIKQSFSTGIFNARGTVSKSPFEGGVKERNLAEHYNKLSKENSAKYPNVAAILANLAKGYAADAEREDIRAKKDELEY